jgi:hypothetical protein
MGGVQAFVDIHKIDKKEKREKASCKQTNA